MRLMQKRRQSSAILASAWRARRTNSSLCCFTVVWLQGNVFLPLTKREKCYPCPGTPVTYVPGPYSLRERGGDEGGASTKSGLRQRKNRGLAGPSAPSERSDAYRARAHAPR
ncbi:protein of unknown function (plasmid) [Cupriavidus taiwanensis]|nr:protein of unknown function [Cupriavidus taiwanensis]